MSTYTLNNISAALLWCINQGAVKGHWAEYGPLLIGLSHDREGCMPPFRLFKTEANNSVLHSSIMQTGWMCLFKFKVFITI